MFSRMDCECRMDELQARLRHAQAVTADQMREIVAGACRRIAMPGRATQSARINRLIAAQAWTDTALALVELELPQWNLRRLACEDGLWLCSLSRHWNVPDWLQDIAEFRHECLPLAIVGALIEARRQGEAPSLPLQTSVPQSPIKARGESLCCDNFS
jgi:hypothetical protein